MKHENFILEKKWYKFMLFTTFVPLFALKKNACLLLQGEKVIHKKKKVYHIKKEKEKRNMVCLEMCDKTWEIAPIISPIL